MRSNRVLAITLLLAALAPLAPCPLLAQPAGTVPVSDRLVEWELVRPGGERAVFAGQEGAMVRVVDEEGAVLGLTPLIEGATPARLRFRVFRLTPVGRQEAIREVGSFVAQEGEAGAYQDQIGTVRVLTVSAGGAAARGFDPEAFRLPFVRRTVRWELALPDGTRASFRVREGEEPQFTSKSLGVSLTFVPEVADARAGKVLLEIRRAGEGRAAGRSESLALEPGVEASSTLVPGMVVRLLGAGGADDVRAAAEACAAGAASSRPTDPRDCCISCPPDGQTCGCAVSTECGSCCDSTCCAGGGKRPR